MAAPALVGAGAPVKLAIAMATHEMVPATFMYDLAAMVAYTSTTMPDGAELGIHMVSGTYVHSARQQLLQMLLEDGATHILWVDTDMRFPRESLAWLIRHNLDVVGINYAKREVPTDYVAIKTLGDRDDPEKWSVRLETTSASTGVEEVDSLGFGLVLMKTSALADLPSLDEKPWFWFEWWPGRRQVGEDVYFCNLLRERGVRIFVDHDLSKLCAHTGQWEYKLAHVEAMRE